MTAPVDNGAVARSPVDKLAVLPRETGTIAV
jgi:hypothetical protein